MAPKRATPRKPLATPRKRSATADPASSWEEDSSGSSTPHDQEVADEEMRESESEEVEDSAAAAAAVDENDEEEESAEDWSEGEGEEESTEDGSEWEAEPDLQPASKNPPQSNKSPTRKRGKTPAPVHQNGENKPQHSESAEPKPKKSRRTWSPDDEVLILEELAKHRRQHGKVPAWGDYAFFESVAKRLEDSSCHYFVVKEKVRTLLRRYKSHILSTTDHDKRLDNLSEDVWGDFQVTDDDPINGGKQAEGEGAMVRAENGSSGQTHARSFDEMCEVYPLLGLEVKMLAEVQLAVKSLFTRLDAKKALYMQKKLERIRSTEVKIQARMAAKVHAPKAKISEKLVRLLT